MAELRDAPGDTTYRPLATFAVAGFAVGCIFGGVLVASALVAIWQGAPVFFPQWSLLIAAAGVVLSWLGHNEIRNAEGTKAGQKLATYGLWISLVSGAGYFAYSYVTGVALSQQAFAFFLNADDDSGFFATLKKGAQDKTELRRAFLLTMPATQRGDIRPEEEATIERLFNKPPKEGARGSLSVFYDHPLVTMVTKAGNPVIEPVSVQEWTYEKRSYLVLCKFRLKTDELSATVVVAARSSEGEAEGQARQWFVDLTSFRPLDTTRTPLGKGLDQLRRHGVAHFQALEGMLRKGKDSPDLSALDATDWEKVEAVSRESIKKRTLAVLSGTMNEPTWTFNVASPSSTEWTRDEQGRVVLRVPFSLLFMSPKEGAMTGLQATARLRTKNAVEPVDLADAPPTSMPEWEATRIEFEPRIMRKQ
jgi:hypothetical protein